MTGNSLEVDSDSVNSCMPRKKSPSIRCILYQKRITLLISNGKLNARDGSLAFDSKGLLQMTLYLARFQFALQ